MKPNIHISILKNPEKSIDFFLTSIKLLCNIYFAVAKYILQCRCSSVVEHQPSKLDMWVRFPSPAYFFALNTGLEGVSKWYKCGTALENTEFLIYPNRLDQIPESIEGWLFASLL